MNNSDLAALARRQQRGWWRRNWRWFVPVLLLALILLGGGAVYWLLFARVYHLDVYMSAMERIAADAGLQRELGQPIRAVSWPPPSARIEAGEKEVRWNIAGPKGQAKAHVLARLMMGNWETIILEVVLPGGRKVSLAEEGSSAADAPLFEGSKPHTEKPEINVPAPVINLPVPPDGRPGSEQ